MNGDDQIYSEAIYKTVMMATCRNKLQPLLIKGMLKERLERKHHLVVQTNNCDHLPWWACRKMGYSMQNCNIHWKQRWNTTDSQEISRVIILLSCNLWWWAALHSEGRASRVILAIISFCCLGSAYFSIPDITFFVAGIYHPQVWYGSMFGSS